MSGVMFGYFGGMLLYLAACRANGYESARDALLSWVWSFAIWERLPAEFGSDGTDPRHLR